MTGLVIPPTWDAEPFADVVKRLHHSPDHATPGDVMRLVSFAQRHMRRDDLHDMAHALTVYGRHGWWCQHSTWLNVPSTARTATPPPCDCGFADVLARARQITDPTPTRPPAGDVPAAGGG